MRRYLSVVALTLTPLLLCGYEQEEATEQGVREEQVETRSQVVRPRVKRSAVSRRTPILKEDVAVQEEDLADELDDEKPRQKRIARHRTPIREEQISDSDQKPVISSKKMKKAVRQKPGARVKQRVAQENPEVTAPKSTMKSRRAERRLKREVQEEEQN
jgi:hypothetical protein